MRKTVFLALGSLAILLFAAQVRGLPEKEGEPPAAPVYIGAKSCRKCHNKDFRHWQKTRHADAWTNLPAEYRKPEKVDEQGRACISCHVTGFGQSEQGGFVDAETSAELLGVQCEACHGAGSRHKEAAELVQKESREFKEGEDRHIVRRPANCVDCHNPHVDHKKYAAGVED